MPISTEVNNKRPRNQRRVSQTRACRVARGGGRARLNGLAPTAQTQRGRGDTIRRAGFTLVELAVVIFIMALMLTLAMPYAGALRDAKLKSAARRLAGRATFLYVQANAQKIVLRLNFDLKANRYFVTWFDPYALKPQFLPYARPGGEAIVLPAGVRVRDVIVADGGEKRSTVVGCNFYPQGFADAAVIHLTSSYGQVMTLALAPLTGRVKIVAGDVPANRLIYAASAW